MREIKFRARGQITNKWYYGLLVFLKDEVCKITNNIIDTWICDSRTLGQFTGLHDKNGVGIYEGDKVIIEKEDDEEIFIIKWDNGTARFTMDSETYTLDFDNYDGKDCEVIGNIHENEDK